MIGGSLAVVGMIWNAIHSARLRRPSLPAVRLLFGGLAIFPFSVALALLLIPEIPPVLLLGVVAMLAMGVATIAIGFRFRDATQGQ